MYAGSVRIMYTALVHCQIGADYVQQMQQSNAYEK